MSLQHSSTVVMPLEGRANHRSFRKGWTIFLSKREAMTAIQFYVNTLESHATTTQATDLPMTFPGKHLSTAPIIPMPREGSLMTKSWFSWRIGTTFQRWAAAQLRQTPTKHEQLGTWEWSWLDTKSM